MKRKIFKSMFAIGTMAILGVASLNVEAKEMYAIYEKDTRYYNEITNHKIKHTSLSKMFEVPDTEVMGDLIGYDEFESGIEWLTVDTNGTKVARPSFYTYIQKFSRRINTAIVAGEIATVKPNVEYKFTRETQTTQKITVEEETVKTRKNSVNIGSTLGAKLESGLSAAIETKMGIENNITTRIKNVHEQSIGEKVTREYKIAPREEEAHYRFETRGTFEVYWITRFKINYARETVDSYDEGMLWWKKTHFRYEYYPVSLEIAEDSNKNTMQCAVLSLLPSTIESGLFEYYKADDGLFYYADASTDKVLYI